MAINKVIYQGNTLIDLTNDTVTPEALAEGVTAHSKSGEVITGIAAGGTGGSANLIEGIFTENGTYEAASYSNLKIVAGSSFEFKSTYTLEDFPSAVIEAAKASSSGFTLLDVDAATIGNYKEEQRIALGFENDELNLMVMFSRDGSSKLYLYANNQWMDYNSSVILDNPPSIDVYTNTAKPLSEISYLFNKNLQYLEVPVNEEVEPIDAGFGVFHGLKFNWPENTDIITYLKENAKIMVSDGINFEFMDISDDYIYSMSDGAWNVGEVLMVAESAFSMEGLNFNDHTLYSMEIPEAGMIGGLLLKTEFSSKPVDGFNTVNINVPNGNLTWSTYKNMQFAITPNNDLIVYADGDIKDDNPPKEYATVRPWEDIEVNNLIITGNNLTRIGNNAFYNCYNSNIIDIPEGVTSIGSNAFDSNNGGATFCLILPSTLTEIDDFAFAGGNIYSVCFRNSTALDNWFKIKFKGMSATPFWKGKSRMYAQGYSPFEITSLTVYNDISEISQYACYRFSFLKSLTIASSVTKIGNYALEGCSNLTSITYEGTVAQWNAITFGTNWNKNTGEYTIHCTDGDITKS